MKYNKFYIIILGDLENIYSYLYKILRHLGKFASPD
tara:strand:+ start:783 stop:890 length:108 start_codon:yes stop_codon:yes gene_type:complete